jgi:hypothetical protein
MPPSLNTTASPSAPQDQNSASPHLSALPMLPPESPAALSPASSDSRRPRHRQWPGWLRLAFRALIVPALLIAVLVPPQSQRATIVTLLIIAALGLLVWRLPTADDE